MLIKICLSGQKFYGFIEFIEFSGKICCKYNKYSHLLPPVQQTNILPDSHQDKGNRQGL